jgi:hypothetical protein
MLLFIHVEISRFGIGRFYPSMLVHRSIHSLSPELIYSTYVEKMSKAELEMETPSSKATLSANHHVVSPVCSIVQNVVRDALRARTVLPSTIGSPPVSPRGRILQLSAEAPSPTPPPDHIIPAPPPLRVEGHPSPVVRCWMIDRTGKSRRDDWRSWWIAGSFGEIAGL